jgi:hypothetical protein
MEVKNERKKVFQDCGTDGDAAVGWFIVSSIGGSRVDNIKLRQFSAGSDVSMRADGEVEKGGGTAH